MNRNNETAEGRCGERQVSPGHRSPNAFMDWSAHSHDDERSVQPIVLRIGPDFTINSIRTIARCLRKSLRARAGVQLDLSPVTAFDAAGLQLLVAARRHAILHRRRFRVTHYSATVASMLDALSCADEVDDPTGTVPAAIRAASLPASPMLCLWCTRCAECVAPDQAPQDRIVEWCDRAVCSDCWHISLRFGQDAMRRGTDPLDIVRLLMRCGEVIRARALLGALPPLARLHPRACYIGLEIDYRSHRSWEAIGSLAHRPGVCYAKALPPASWLSRYDALMDTAPDGRAAMRALLEEMGTLTVEEATACETRRAWRSDETSASAFEPLRSTGCA